MSILSGIGQEPPIFGTGGGTATSLAGGTAGSIPYQSAPDTTAFLPNGNAGQFLTSQGTTLAPIWTTPNGLVYSNFIGTTTNLTDPTTNPTTIVNAFNNVPIGVGTFLVSFQLSLINLDTAPVTFSNYQINLVQSATVLADYRQQIITLASTQIYNFVFSAVVNNPVSPPNTNAVIYLTVSSGAFATTAPTITTDNVTIVKIAN